MTISTTTLAVKYRPTSLSEVVGQDEAVRNLQDSIDSGKYSSAYLFDGKTGCGKTTLAKILAQHLSCSKGTACGKCGACRAGAKANPDIVHIDAATSGKVDDIRDLCKFAYVSPMYSKRVIIIDECFPADTEVLMSDGTSRHIRDIKGGDHVRSYNTDTDTVESNVVQRFIYQGEKELVRVHLEDNSYQDCTPNHKWLSVTSGEMVRADELMEGESLLASDHSTVIVSRIEKLNTPPVNVYDITVANNHNFFIIPKGSKKAILVSNCHMLTGAAAQALLVTLEEPPRDTVFILCTTDPEKLLPTIRGRCTRMQLLDVPVQAMVKRLISIVKKEKGKVNKEEVKPGLKLLAELADGSMRQAISLLENVINTDMSPAVVESRFRSSNKSVVDVYTAAANTVAAVLAGDIPDAVKAIRSSEQRSIIYEVSSLLDNVIGKMCGYSDTNTYSMRILRNLIKSKKLETDITILSLYLARVSDIKYENLYKTTLQNITVVFINEQFSKRIAS